MKTKQLIEKLKEYIKALEKRVGNYELSHIELINLRHSICILEGKLEFASIEQKREKIIDILESDYNIDNIENVGNIADAILAIEQEESKSARNFICHKYDEINEKRRGTWKWKDVMNSSMTRISFTQIADWMEEYAQQPQNQGTDLPLVK